MKRSDYAGWKEVFSFSLRQEMKQKSFRGLLIVMCVLILAFVPVSTWLSQRGEEQEKDTEVSLLTIYDETGLHIDYTHALEGERYAAMQVAQAPGEGFEEHVKALEESEDSTELIVHIAYEEAGYFNLTFVKAASAALKDKDCDKLTEDFESFFQDARISAGLYQSAGGNPDRVHYPGGGDHSRGGGRGNLHDGVLCAAGGNRDRYDDRQYGGRADRLFHSHGEKLQGRGISDDQCAPYGADRG